MTSCLIDSPAAAQSISPALLSQRRARTASTPQLVTRQRPRRVVLLVRLARQFAALGSVGATALSERTLSSLSQSDRFGERR